MKKLRKILGFIPIKYVDDIMECLTNSEIAEEIRLRVNKPIFIKTRERKFFLHNQEVISSHKLKEIIEKLGGYSLYSFEEELAQGYFTLKGGHRVGFAGKAVVENGQVKTLHKISSLNIRIAHDVKDCSKPWLKYLFEQNGQLCHIFIVAPPGCGKTTFLRDIIRQLSYGNFNNEIFTIGIVDERGEIAGMENGVPQMDLGNSVDIQENCPKTLGMSFLLRSMSPEVIAVDELGKEEDFQKVEELIHGGVKILATVHGHDFNKYVGKKYLNNIFNEIDYGRMIFLSNKNGTGTVESIYNEKGERIL